MHMHTHAEMAGGMVSSGLSKVGFEHIWLDDGWAVSRDNKTGVLLEDRALFPSGIGTVGAPRRAAPRGWLHEGRSTDLLHMWGRRYIVYWRARSTKAAPWGFYTDMRSIY